MFNLAVTLFWSGQARQQENPKYAPVRIYLHGMTDHGNSSLCWSNTGHRGGDHFPQFLVLHKAPS